jgi:hypothetical protein
MKRRNRKPPPPKAVRRAEWKARWTRLLGLAFCTAGFVAIVLGWAGAARKSCVDCQIPYLISGGAAGVTMLVFGTGLLVMAQMRTESRRLSAKLEHVTWTRAERFMGATAGPMNGDAAGQSSDVPDGTSAEPVQTKSAHAVRARARNEPIQLRRGEPERRADANPSERERRD